MFDRILHLPIDTNRTGCTLTRESTASGDAWSALDRVVVNNTGAHLVDWRKRVTWHHVGRIDSERK